MSIQKLVGQYYYPNYYQAMADYYKMQQVFGVKCPHCSKEIDAPWWSGDIGEEVADKDYIAANALLTMAILNGPTDVDDIFSAIRQIKSGFKETQPDGYDPKVAQHPFSFFRGTVLHEYLNPNSEKCVDKEWAKKIIKEDVSLEETEFGCKILDRLGVEEVGRIQSSVKDMTYSEKNPFYVSAKTFKSKTQFAELTARALCRTSKIGAFTLAGIGVLQASHEIGEGKNPLKEILRAAVQVLSTLLGVGYLGAFGYKKYGALGSLVGMALGTFTGKKVTELLF